MDPPTSSGVKRPSLPSRTSSEPSAKRAKHNLPGHQLEEVNAQMNTEAEFFRSSFSAAADDPKKMGTIRSSILVSLTEALSSTDAKSTVLAPVTKPQARNFFHGFNPQELKEWMDGMREGMDNCDWADLIAHRTCYIHLETRVAFDDGHSQT